MWNGKQGDPKILIDAVIRSGPNLEKASGCGGGDCDTGRGSADLAEVLHGGPQVEQHVLHCAQDLGHWEAREGSPQLRLDTLVQERALLLVGRLQQGAEGSSWGTIRARTAQGLKGLGRQQQSGKRNDKAPQMKKVHGLVTRVQGDTHRDIPQQPRTHTATPVTTWRTSNFSPNVIGHMCLPRVLVGRP